MYESLQKMQRCEESKRVTAGWEEMQKMFTGVRRLDMGGCRERERGTVTGEGNSLDGRERAYACGILKRIGL